MPNLPGKSQRSERGAALLTTLMIAAMLLAAGGMLIVTTSMSAINTIDSATEVQAYYGAEAGLQAALNVLRGNVPPNPLFDPDTSAPQNQVDFQKALTRSTSNLPSDPTTSGFPARLSRWLTYNYIPSGFSYADRVTLTQGYTPFNGIAYSLALSDPDNTVAPNTPTRMIIQSTGYGPRGARKILTMVVSAYGLDVVLPATLVLRGHDDHVTPMYLDLGNSAAKTYLGLDNAGAQPQKPAFAISNHDVPVAEAAYGSKPDTVSNPKYGVLDLPGEPAPPADRVPSPWFFRTADDARAFMVQAESIARKKGVILNSLSGYAGSAANPQFTFVKGDCTLEGGAGLLIVTGRLMFHAAGPDFNGIILVMGEGQVTKTGGGNNDIFGGMAVARFGATGGFLQPIFDYSGGSGSSNLQYDSQQTAIGLATTGPLVQGIAEK